MLTVVTKSRMKPKVKHRPVKFPTDFNTDEARVAHVWVFVAQSCVKTGQSCFLCQLHTYMPSVGKCVMRTEEMCSQGATNRVFTSMITVTSHVCSKVHRHLQVTRQAMYKVTMRRLCITTVSVEKP